MYKFYQSYVDLLRLDYEFRKNGIPEFDNKLRHSKFREFVVGKCGKSYKTIVKIAPIMRMGMLRPQRLLLDSDNYYLACDMITNTYYLCYKYLMMIDIDFYKQSETPESGAEVIQKFQNDIRENPQNCWRLYRTKGGIHAFLTSKEAMYSSKESIEVMLKFQGDFNYVIYSYLRGWCVRLNRKQQEEKVVHDHIETIGNSSLEIPELVKLVELHLRFIKIFENEDPSIMYGV